MDFDMDALFIESFFSEVVDIDYEFDAAKYYDFTRPETVFEAQEAERWFEITGYYPPSPLKVKPSWELSIPVQSGNSSSICKATENTNPTSGDLSTSMDFETTSADNKSRPESYNEATSSTKSPALKNSNFMNPTTSQLAKQNRPPQIHCDRLLRQSQKSVKFEECSQSSSMTGTQATKKQKLDASYSWKLALLKHRELLLQKARPKKVGQIDFHTTFAKPKATIAREPNLETACRAESRRSKTNLESIQTAKSTCNFRARPLNRKILEAPLFPLPKKSNKQLPEFQVFHLRTSERAVQHASAIAANAPNSGPIPQNETRSSTRLTPVAALKEKLETFDKFKDCCLKKKECNFPNDRRFPNEPPVEAFSKLSLTSKVDSNVNSRSKSHWMLRAQRRMHQVLFIQDMR
ncbi:hypothetical protein MANES_06G138800v8 [Manihot esculenta]|uniref:Uncharacterized protein n=2 Tax=Manihot esculenta TaxID=3983 RepID=A0ACB7HLH0_MANES|nr:hypothetical protein MANES_06G138800v8 [Manihot esculenta]KAG8652821.1 hypothetical protein MANES_06G138800v8 [Manihot esculenta]